MVKVFELLVDDDYEMITPDGFDEIMLEKLTELFHTVGVDIVGAVYDRPDDDEPMKVITKMIEDLFHKFDERRIAVQLQAVLDEIKRIEGVS